MTLQGEALVDSGGRVWLPYDRPHLRAPGGWRRLSSLRSVRHAGRAPFRWTPPASGSLHVLNGMGVTLGDSIIGLNALAWLKSIQPGLKIHLYRTPHAPRHVERLYELAGHLVDAVHHLPRRLETLPDDVVDLSDFLHWPRFATDPMVDFFMHGLGIAPDEVPAAAKSNRWLTRLRAPAVPSPDVAPDYVLLCDQASTPLRCIPQAQRVVLVERIWRRYRLPVVGFHPIAHPHFHDVSARSRDLDQFLAWVGNARAVVATDSAAVHIAAGHDVPTLAFFISIDPVLRTRDYAMCRSVDARCELTDGLHASDDPQVLAEVDRVWASLARRDDLPWPVPRTRATVAPCLDEGAPCRTT